MISLKGEEVDSVFVAILTASGSVVDAYLVAISSCRLIKLGDFRTPPLAAIAEAFVCNSA